MSIEDDPATRRGTTVAADTHKGTLALAGIDAYTGEQPNEAPIEANRPTWNHDGMLRRFEPDAVAVLHLAEEHAIALGQSRVQSEHILLAVLHSEDVLVTTLDRCGVTAAGVHAAILETTGLGRACAIRPLPFSTDAAQVPELAVREALAAGRDRVNVEHVFLALLRDQNGPASDTVRSLGANPASLRAAIAGGR